MFEVGDIVEIKYRPVGCCGVLRQGWFGRVQSCIDVQHTGTKEDKQILVLDDNSLVWADECVHRETSRLS